MRTTVSQQQQQDHSLLCQFCFGDLQINDPRAVSMPRVLVYVACHRDFCVVRLDQLCFAGVEDKPLKDLHQPQEPKNDFTHFH